MSLGARQVVSGDDFRRLSQRFRQEAQSSVELEGRISSALRGSIWEGPARQNFQGDWDGQYVPALRKLRDALEGLSQELDSRARIADELARR